MLNQNDTTHYGGERLCVDTIINNNDIIINNIRTNYSKFGNYDLADDFNIQRIDRTDDKYMDHSRVDTNNIHSTENTKKNINSSIYRYKFDDSLIIEIHNFAKIHEFDGRKDFKEAWNKWVVDNNTMISQETQRLIDLGYHGDVIDKMFKSTRYYFRKKCTEKKKPQKRRIYIGLQKELLERMDNHILNNIKNEDYKPANGFDNFCKENLDLLKNQVNNLISFNITDKDEIKNKIKKTYKNRYFMIINK
jgi:hypothetical protein